MSSPDAPAVPVVPDPSARKRRLARIALVLAVAGAGAWSWDYFVGRFHVVTENAYVGGDMVPVTAEVAGVINSVDIEATMAVVEGQSLARLDTADAELRLQAAEAALTQALLDARGQFANLKSLDAQVSARDAEVNQAQTQLAKARAELERRRNLKRSGATTAEELSNAELAVDAATAALEASRQRHRAAMADLDAQRTRLTGLTVTTHPAVTRAATEARSAWLARERTHFRATTAGTVARRSVEVGQRVKPGDTLFTLVPLDKVWVDANFKEDQLAHVRLGQPVELRSDFYGRDVVFHGVVGGISAGSGSSFSLLPAQNATGNWIKVVQRLPLRIVLDANELREHPLRVGLSMEASIDVRDVSGPALSPPPGVTFHQGTPIRDGLLDAADAHVNSLIARLAGGH